MENYWLSDNGQDETFWEHEWAKHGTCYSTLNPDCYTDYVPQEEVVDFFNVTATLFESLPTYQWLADAGITPSNQQYSSSDILNALQQGFGESVIISCSDGALSQVEYTFNVQGSVDGGSFIPVGPTDSLATARATSTTTPRIRTLPRSLLRPLARTANRHRIRSAVAVVVGGRDKVIDRVIAVEFSVMETA